jgi:hypothetical protein
LKDRVLFELMLNELPQFRKGQLEDVEPKPYLRREDQPLFLPLDWLNAWFHAGKRSVFFQEYTISIRSP